MKIFLSIAFVIFFQVATAQVATDTTTQLLSPQWVKYAPILGQPIPIDSLNNFWKQFITSIDRDTINIRDIKLPADHIKEMDLIGFALSDPEIADRTPLLQVDKKLLEYIKDNCAVISVNAKLFYKVGDAWVRVKIKK